MNFKKSVNECKEEFFKVLAAWMCPSWSTNDDSVKLFKCSTSTRFITLSLCSWQCDCIRWGTNTNCNISSTSLWDTSWLLHCIGGRASVFNTAVRYRNDVSGSLLLRLIATWSRSDVNLYFLWKCQRWWIISSCIMFAVTVFWNVNFNRLADAKKRTS